MSAKPRYKRGQLVLREIRHLQHSVAPILRHAPLDRHLRTHLGATQRLTAETTDMIQTALEDFLHGMLDDARSICEFNKRQTVGQRDIALALRFSPLARSLQ